MLLKGVNMLNRCETVDNRCENGANRCKKGVNRCEKGVDMCVNKVLKDVNKLIAGVKRLLTGAKRVLTGVIINLPNVELCISKFGNHNCGISKRPVEFPWGCDSGSRDGSMLSPDHSKKGGT